MQFDIVCRKSQIEAIPGSDRFLIRTPRGNMLTIWQTGEPRELRKDGPGDRESIQKVSSPSDSYDLYLADRSSYKDDDGKAIVGPQVYLIAAF